MLCKRNFKKFLCVIIGCIANFAIFYSFVKKYKKTREI